MTTMSKTTAILNFKKSDNIGRAVFECEGDPGDVGRNHYLKVDAEIYEELGSPEVITVSIEPGDLLNAA